VTVVNSRLVLILVVKRFLVKSVEFKYDTAVDLSSLSLSLFLEDCGVCLTAVLHQPSIWVCALVPSGGCVGDGDVECSGNGVCSLGVCSCTSGSGIACGALGEDWVIPFLIALGCITGTILVVVAVVWVITIYRTNLKLRRKRQLGFEKVLDTAEARNCSKALSRHVQSTREVR